jgi:hypothetical protein
MAVQPAGVQFIGLRIGALFLGRDAGVADQASGGGGTLPTLKTYQKSGSFPLPELPSFDGRASPRPVRRQWGVPRVVLLPPLMRRFPSLSGRAWVGISGGVSGPVYKRRSYM